jgi:hypothetical protein
VKEKTVLAYIMLQTRRMEKSIVCTKDGPGHFILIQQKWKKTLSAGPILALYVPMTKDGPGHFILIQPTVLSLCVILNRRRRKAGYVATVCPFST